MSTKKDILRLAIVNRGEAAMRCVRAVKALRAIEGSDLRCIALYTDVERDAPFVRAADAAVRLPFNSGESTAYLDHHRVIAALQRGGADAAWPGWGPAAENPRFAERLAEVDAITPQKIAAYLEQYPIIEGGHLISVGPRDWHVAAGE